MMLELNKVYNTECIEGMKQIDDKSIDMILCDLPYGQTKCAWDSVIPFELLWEQYNRIIKDNGVIALFGSEPFSSALRMSNIKNYKYDWYWDKLAPTGQLNAKKQPMRQIENISIFYKKQCTYNPQLVELSEEEYQKKIKKITRKEDEVSSSTITNKRKEMVLNTTQLEDYKYRQPITILQYSKYMKECNNSHRLHSTQKPVDMLSYLIKTYTNEGNIILDNCCGSGSTGVACVETNRKYILMDNGKCENKNSQNYDKYWTDISRERINEYIIK